MGKNDKRGDAKISAASLVRIGGKNEKRLLRREHEAEQALTSARARLRKAQLRLERRLGAVADAEATLRGHQEARSLGPNGNGTNGLDTILVLPAAPEASGNGAAPAIITGPDVATEIAAMEVSASVPPPATPTKRPSRAKSAVKPSPSDAPAATKAEIIIPAPKPAPARRARPSRAKTTDGAS